MSTKKDELWRCMRFIISLNLFYFICLGAFAQVVNGYARVTAIAVNTFNVSNVNEGGDTFEDGEQVIIYQTKDNVIGGNTSDNISFGDISTILTAGRYEVRTRASHTESAGLPTSITLSSATSNSYNINANARVQIITYPTLGSPDYTTSGTLTALAWNGNVGGVLALRVEGTLTLANNISVNGQGFRGGSRSANYYSGGTGCTGVPEYIRTSNHTRAAEKGEGIYEPSSIDQRYARGKLINGGGGGAERINTGGGGGGNFSAGGAGGRGWSCNTDPGGGGVGGIDLSPYISASRIFLGGGGGGGQQNNSASTDGARGGGLILIAADTIETTGTCGGRNISANGNNASNGGNDGQGGGGAGGSIILNVNNWNINASCLLTISGNGGDGGDVNSSTHAGGGGGGQGVVIYSTAQPTSNMTTLTNVGQGGCANSGCSIVATSGGGTPGTGIIDEAPGPLPIELLSFEVEEIGANAVLISWETATEVNNDYFTIEKSIDIENWIEVSVLSGAGNSNVRNSYQIIDELLNATTLFYRLKQTDFDGTSSYSQIVIIALSGNESDELTLFPNPANNEIQLIGNLRGLSSVLLFDRFGRDLSEVVSVSVVSGSQVSIDISDLKAGLYIIQTGYYSLRFVKQ